jgi:hypothetical protein
LGVLFFSSSPHVKTVYQEKLPRVMVQKVVSDCTENEDFSESPISIRQLPHSSETVNKGNQSTSLKGKGNALTGKRRGIK